MLDTEGETPEVGADVWTSETLASVATPANPKPEEGVPLAASADPPQEPPLEPPAILGPFRDRPPAPPRAQKLPRRGMPLRELAGAITLVGLLDLAFYGSTGYTAGGFSLALLLAGAGSIVLLSARTRRVSIRAIAIGVMLALTALRSLIDPNVATTLIGLALVPALAITLRARGMHVPEVVRSMLASLPAIMFRVASAWARLSTVLERSRLRNVSVWPIVIPLVVSASFIGVFALANPAVADAFGWIFDRAQPASIANPVRIMVWVLAIPAALALARPSVKRGRGVEDTEHTSESTTVSRQVARNTLIVLNLVFLAYNALDLVYLWFGTLPEGMTAQHYAHHGAFWLTVALAALSVVVGVFFRGPLAHDGAARSIRVLAYVWISQGLLLAIGTYGRIGVHLLDSGLSDLRIVGILGTTLVTTGAVLIAIKLRQRRSFTWLLRRQLDAFAITFLLYAVAPTHFVSAHFNVMRAERGQYAPLLHVVAQAESNEAAPVLLDLLDHPDPLVRRGVAAVLGTKLRSLELERLHRHGWREGDVLTESTYRALEAARGRMADELGIADPTNSRRMLEDLAYIEKDGEPLYGADVYGTPQAQDPYFQ